MRLLPCTGGTARGPTASPAEAETTDPTGDDELYGDGGPDHLDGGAGVDGCSSAKEYVGREKRSERLGVLGSRGPHGA